MNYKFQVGDLVRVPFPSGSPLGDLPLGLVTDHLGVSYDAPAVWYKILIQGYTVDVPEYELRKVNKNEL